MRQRRASAPLLTIAEILHRQRHTHGAELYLLLQGMFYHAYNQAAYAFQSSTGYKVRTVPYHGGYIEQLGIPIDLLDTALCAFLQSRNAIVEYIGKHVHITML